MPSVYFVRHQAAGLLTDYPFAGAPTDEQKAALSKLCFQRHGGTHAKTGEPYWLKVVALDTLGPGDVPHVPERSLSVASVAGATEFLVSGEGEVQNP